MLNVVKKKLPQPRNGPVTSHINRLDGTLHVYNYDDILLSSQVKFNWSSIE